MRRGLQLPSFTFPGGPAAIRSTLTEIGQTAEAAVAHRLDQIPTLGREVFPEVEGLIAA